MKWGRDVAVAAVLGSVITLCDRMHWRHHVLEYPNGGSLGGQPFWVPFLFGASSVALVFGHRWVIGYKLGAPPPATARTAAWQTGLFVLAYACTAWFHAHTALLTLGLLLAFIPVVIRNRYAGFLCFAGLAAVVGPMVEIVISSGGAFRYVEPRLGLIQPWLPALYLWVAYCGAGLDRWLLAT